jgi:hypothetical protein
MRQLNTKKMNKLEKPLKRASTEYREEVKGVLEKIVKHKTHQLTSTTTQQNDIDDKKLSRSSRIIVYKKKLMLMLTECLRHSTILEDDIWIF